MDTELFELCKEVYERTQWDKLEKAYYRRGHYWSDNEEYGPDEPFIADNDGTNVDFPYEFLAPLYTSDYLLEKLPVVTLSSGYGGSWSATDRKIDNPMVIISNTPLKAILKLTIDLHEAGELK